MEASSSFTPLGSIQPPGPSLLLPGACNPVMDLVTLVTTPSHIPLTGKGKQKAGDERRISLWRVSGSRVWDVGYEGTLLGLAWSADGKCNLRAVYATSGLIGRSVLVRPAARHLPR
jgi:hypothetical protein